MTCASTIHELRASLARYQSERARRAGWQRRFFPTGVTPLDHALPHEGLPYGAITEIFSPAPGMGAMTLALRIACRAMLPEESLEDRSWSGDDGPAGPIGNGITGLRTPIRFRHHPSRGEAPLLHFGDRVRPCWPAGEISAPHINMDDASISHVHSGGLPAPQTSHLLVLDTTGDFYPPAVAAFGLDPERLIVVRTANRRDAFWVMDQSLRCPGVGAVLAFLPELDERQSRRLQLAAESSGSIGLLLCGPQKKGRSFAAVRILLEPTMDSASNRAALPCVASFPVRRDRFVARISLLSVREGMPSGPYLVDLYHATGACDLPPLSLDRSAARFA